MKKQKKSVDPQLQHDPAFLQRVEHILERELNEMQTWDHNSEIEQTETQINPQSTLASKSAHERSRKANSASKRSKESVRNELLKELEDLLPQLDEVGLAFLLEQGRIHLYNMKVDELNALSQGIATKKTGASKSKPAPSFQIKAGSGGGSYHVAYKGNWKIFSDAEMLRMVQIANSEGTQEERASRLFRWFRTERLDVLQDIPFKGASDSLLIEFVTLLQKTFTIRKQ